MTVLDISPFLLLFTAIVFLALLFYLNKTLYQPLIEFMTNREHVIEKDKHNATKNAEDVQVYENEAREIILDAKAQAAKERAEILEEAKAKIQTQINQRKSELEEEYQLFLKNMQDEKTELKNGLLAQIPLFREGIKAKLNQL